VVPQDPKDVSRDIARDLSALVGEIAALKGDANHWLEGPEYAALKHRLEAAHAAVEAALIEARRRVRLNEERWPSGGASTPPNFPRIGVLPTSD
jgi:hypothetical protein